MERALISTPYTARATYYSGSTATNPTPDTATVEVVRADGTTVVAAGAAAVNDTLSGNGVFSYTFTTAQMAALDTFEIRWKATMGGQVSTIKTFVQIVGGFICTLAELKTLFPNDTDADLASKRIAAEQRIEAACRRAFVPRLAVESRSVRSRVYLSWPDVRLIRFVLLDGVAVSAGTLASLSVSPSGFVTGLPGSSKPFYRIIIGYEYGADYPSESIREGVLLAAEETFSDTEDANVIRREADRQSVTFASPSSSGSFNNPVLKRIVRDNAAPMVV